MKKTFEVTVNVADATDTTDEEIIQRIWQEVFGWDWDTIDVKRASWDFDHREDVVGK